MKLFLSVVKNDLKIIFRDSTMYIMFFLPLIFIALCRFLVPLATRYLLPVLPEYYWLIVAGFTSVSASTPSFLTGFILLDERDENIHVLQKVLPLPANFILKCRTIFMVIASFFFSIIILQFNGLINLKFIYLVMISVLFSFIPPILTFSIVAFAKNKIEATTMYKGLSMFLVLPVAAFFIKSGWKYGFGAIPFFWTFNAFQLEGALWLSLGNFLIGLVVHLIFIVLFYTLYKKKITV